MKTQTEKKTIAVCPECENPLIPTFHFAQAEWFCMNCKHAHGFLFEKRIPVTRALKAKLKSDTAEFDTFKNDLYLGGEKIKGCKLCEEKKESHIHHLTEEERNKCIEARKKIGWDK